MNNCPDCTSKLTWCSTHSHNFCEDCEWEESK